MVYFTQSLHYRDGESRPGPRRNFCACFSPVGLYRPGAEGSHNFLLRLRPGYAGRLAIQFLTQVAGPMLRKAEDCDTWIFDRSIRGQGKSRVPMWRHFLCASHDHISGYCTLFRALRAPALAALPNPLRLVPVCFKCTREVPATLVITQSALHTSQTALVDIWQRIGSATKRNGIPLKSCRGLSMQAFSAASDARLKIIKSSCPNASSPPVKNTEHTPSPA